MRPEGDMLPGPTIGQSLGVGHRGEQLGIEELIPEPAVERFGKAVLPLGSWVDGGCCCAAALAPTLEGVGDVVRPVVTADEHRRRVKTGVGHSDEKIWPLAAKNGFIITTRQRIPKLQSAARCSTKSDLTGGWQHQHRRNTP